MTILRSVLVSRCVCALSLFTLAAAACRPASCEEAWTPARSLAARGPLALSVAAGQHTGRWALESGWPFGAASWGGAASDLSHERSRFDARVLVIAEQDGAGASGAAYGASYALLLDHAAGVSSRWLGLSLGGAQPRQGPRSHLRLAAGLGHAFAAVQGDIAVVSTPVLFHDDPRWTRTVHWRYSAGSDSVGRDTSTTVPADHSALWTTAQGSLRWQSGRMAFETVAGLSLGEGVSARRWAQGTLRLQLSRRVLALASVGERPVPSLAFDGASHPHTMLGLQFAPWSTREWAMVHSLRPLVARWTSAPAGPGRTLVRVHARETHRVEVTGDFTDWQPVELLALHGGWWGRVLPTDPGLHHVQVRLDGGPWQVPPGLPRTADGPAGDSGTLLVR